MRSQKKRALWGRIGTAIVVPAHPPASTNAAQGSETGGDPERGAALIGRIGFGTCHIVPGIPDATGLVGPPLDHMGSRIYIAGVLRNTPGNMIAWLCDPQAVVPGNAMPNMGLDRKQAQDVAGYLYTLR